MDYANTDYVKSACSGFGAIRIPEPMPKSQFTDAYAAMVRSLRTLREQRSVSQVELAARLGKEQPFISRIERGERRLDVIEFYAIARALGIDPAEAFGTITTNLPKKVTI